MTAPRFAVLEDRGVLAIEGTDARAFLQGLVSNDVTKAGPARAIYAALLTPQGKFLHDFFIAELAEVLLLDCEKARLADLKRRLGLYKLRAQVTIADRSADLAVAALFGDGALGALVLPDQAGAARGFANGIAFVDPRLASAGARAIAPRESLRAGAIAVGFAETGADDYDKMRISLGLPDGSRDLEVERAILLENGFEELNGVDWNKGCYMGQELTARTKYRGLVRKRLMPVAIEGPAPAFGAPIRFGEADAGEMRSSRGGIGLALLRLEKVAEARAAGMPLSAGDARLIPIKPDWAKFQSA
jgi:folate-binding protein YgfZ